MKFLKCLTICTVLMVSSSLATAASTHPFHVSVAEVEWNSRTQRLEIALRLWPNDLEKVLSRRAKQKVDLDKTPDVDQLIVDYLQENFLVTGGRKKEKNEILWVGKEILTKHAWLYFEIPCPHDPAGMVFENRILFELLSDQENIINFKRGKKVTSLLCTVRKPKQTLK